MITCLINACTIVLLLMYLISEAPSDFIKWSVFSYFDIDTTLIPGQINVFAAFFLLIVVVSKLISVFCIFNLLIGAWCLEMLGFLEPCDPCYKRKVTCLNMCSLCGTTCWFFCQVLCSIR